MPEATTAMWGDATWTLTKNDKKTRKPPANFAESHKKKQKMFAPPPPVSPPSVGLPVWGSFASQEEHTHAPHRIAIERRAALDDEVAGGHEEVVDLRSARVRYGPVRPPGLSPGQTQPAAFLHPNCLDANLGFCLGRASTGIRPSAGVLSTWQAEAANRSEI